MTGKTNADQKQQWQTLFCQSNAFFGEQPSELAQMALDRFQHNKVGRLLELGAGQGRDTLLFAHNKMVVTALDYAENAVEQINTKAAAAGLQDYVSAHVCDLREALPFVDGQFEACYAHMLLCMELCSVEIANILRELHRVLTPGGLVIYSVRSNFDKHYRLGLQRGEDCYEIDGLVVRFFTEQMILRFSKGYEILQLERRQEGSLPRDLFCVTMQKGPAPTSWELDACAEKAMHEQLDLGKAADAASQFSHVPLIPPGKT